MGAEAVELYRQMPANLQDTITHICALNACSHAGLVDQARSIYKQIDTKTDRVVTTMVGYTEPSLFTRSDERC